MGRRRMGGVNVSMMPRTPFYRLLDSGVLSPTQVEEMTAYRDGLNPTKIAAEIARVQDRLLVLSRSKTGQLYLASFPSVLPDVRKGVRVKTARVSRAILSEASETFRGHIDMRYYGAFFNRAEAESSVADRDA